MTNERIDQILAKEQELVPSSGFLSSVMERVREEAAAPPPIPFPWKRFVPGIIVGAGVLGWGAVELVRFVAPRLHEVRLTPPHIPPATTQPLEQAGWIVATLAVSLVSWMISRRAVR
jgi:hypothetical protein